LAIEVTQTSDLFVIVGTTMQVQPASSPMLVLLVNTPLLIKF